MKLLLLCAACMISVFSFCQEVTFQYKNENGVTEPPVPIKGDTKKISIKKSNLTEFTIIATGIPEGGKLVFADKNDIAIGEYLPADQQKEFKSRADLNNKGLIVYLVNKEGKKTQFAKLALLDELPSSEFNVTESLSSWMAIVGKVCEPCNVSGRAMEYDFSKNLVSPRSFTSWPKKYAKVNSPYQFIVKNINPFRDSVILSSETVNYNTEVPDLFTKAYFSTAAVGLAEDNAALLADLLALKEQIAVIVNSLRQARECDDICSFIQKTKDKTEDYFKNNYQFDASKKDLISFLADALQGINEAYKEDVTEALTSYKAFINARNYFSYYIPGIQNVDAYEFNVTILPKSGAQLPVIVDHQPVTVPVLGGWKFDFSSGVYLTRLRDQSFSLKPDSSVISNSFGGDSIVFNRRNQIFFQNGEKGSDFGVTALMHIYPRISPFINISATIGAGLSIGPNPSIRYLGGGSLLFGRNGRLALTYGCAAGFVEQLAAPYQQGQFVSTSDKSQLTKKSFTTNSFMSVSFSIPLFKSKVKASEAAPAKATETDEKKEEGEAKETEEAKK